MNILVCFVHWSIATGWHYVNAFRRLGHTVKTTGPVLSDAPFWGVKSTAPDCPVGTVQQAGRGHIDAGLVLDTMSQKAFSPDLIVTASGFFTLLGETPCPHVLINHEPPQYNEGVEEDAANWNWVFTANPTYPHLGEEWCKYLPMGYDPMLHRNRVPWRDRPIPATFVGRMEERRLAMIQTIIDKHAIAAWRGLTWEQYATLTNAGRATLNIPLVEQPGLSPRLFEAMAMGALYLTPENDELARMGLKPEQHYLPYETVGDVTDWLERIANEPPEWYEAILLRAQGWVMGQTYDARCEYILNTIGGN